MAQSRVTSLLFVLPLLARGTENGRRGSGRRWAESERSSLRLGQRRAMHAAGRTMTANRGKRCRSG